MATQNYSKAPFSPTRFPAGITNANVGEPLGNFSGPDPSKAQTVFDDFGLGVGSWTVATTAATAGPGGLLTMTGTVTPAIVQTPLASFALVEGYRAFAKAGVALVSDTATSFILGFADDMDVPTNGVYITVVNQTLTLTVGTTNSAAVAVTYAANEQVKLGIEVNPNGDVLAYFNDGVVARISDSSLVPYNTNFLFGASSTDNNSTLDYLFGSVER